jgi:hypothetical protein
VVEALWIILSHNDRKVSRFVCYFLAGIGNKQISALKKDIAMFLDHSGTSDQAIDALSNKQLNSTLRENRREKNIISSIYS